MLVNMFPEVIFNKRVLSGTVFPRIWLFCFVRSTKLWSFNNILKSNRTTETHTISCVKISEVKTN